MSLSLLSSLAVPLFILLALILCTLRRKNAYSAFISGAADGFRGAVSVMPYLLAVLFAVELFEASGLASAAGSLLSDFLLLIGLPEGLGLFLLIRPLSGSGALAELGRIFSLYGPDSSQGIFASVFMGSTETIFYTVPVYLSAARLKSSPKAIIIGLISMLAGLVTALLILNFS